MEASLVPACWQFAETLLARRTGDFDMRMPFQSAALQAKMEKSYVSMYFESVATTLFG